MAKTTVAPKRPKRTLVEGDLLDWVIGQLRRLNKVRELVLELDDGRGVSGREVVSRLNVALELSPPPSPPRRGSHLRVIRGKEGA